MKISIRSEANEDWQSIWTLNRTAFEGDDEANLVDGLRDGGFVVGALVAEFDGKIVGHILFSHVLIVTENETVDAVSLAPMAVRPDFQRQGIGSQLVRAGLQTCRKHGQAIAVVLGHPEFYPRFGFSTDLARPLESPFGGGAA